MKEASLPAPDPLVLGVGGTTLTASHTTGAYIGESAWGLAFGEPGSHFQASGGGISRIFSRPSYQAQIPSIGCPPWRARRRRDRLAPHRVGGDHQHRSRQVHG
jgi:subtilase family serine protease